MLVGSFFVNAPNIYFLMPLNEAIVIMNFCKNKFKLSFFSQKTLNVGREIAKKLSVRAQPGIASSRELEFSRRGDDFQKVSKFLSTFF